MELYDENAGRGLTIAALVVGIFALLVSCLPIGGLILALVALSLGIAGYTKSKNAGVKNKMAIGTFVVTILALIISASATIFALSKIDGDIIEDFNNWNYNNNDYFYDQNQKLDEINNNFDSLNMTPEDLDKINKASEDFDNGPGGAPSK